MSLFNEICNRALCHELKREEGDTIVIFTADGFSYFGLVDLVDDRVVTLSNVQVLTPGGNSFGDTFVNIDICTIVGKLRGVNNDPFNVNAPG